MDIFHFPSFFMAYIYHFLPCQLPNQKIWKIKGGYLQFSVFFLMLISLIICTFYYVDILHFLSFFNVDILHFCTFLNVNILHFLSFFLVYLFHFLLCQLLNQKKWQIEGGYISFSELFIMWISFFFCIF